MDNEEEQMNASTSASTSNIASGSGSGDTEIGGTALSKNAMKRAAKQARLQAEKPAKRAHEKQRRRERLQYLAEGHANGTLTPEETAIYTEKKARVSTREAARHKVGHGEVAGDWKGGVVVDLEFDELMTDKEISSMHSQLMFLYSQNRTASRPFANILHTSFSPEASPRMWKSMINMCWNRWSRASWWGESIGDLAKVMRGESVTGSIQPVEGVDLGVEGSDDKGEGSSDLRSFLSGPRLPAGWEDHKLVYLSADAEEELETLKEDEVYIIGGLVDRNRHKYICQTKADKLGIRTARLPIGTYLANLPTRKVLTVNQVFEILIYYIEMNDWTKAMEKVMPARKFLTAKRRRGNKGVVAGGDESEEAEHEDEEQEERELTNEEEVLNSVS